ncbi:response regulator [Angustibacter sp. McL0619]|uniref:response regulator n=1 Tax=Angustibacter sp. McL0619 TaxID=3415676 RepID=UPI003CF1757E
MPDVRVLIVDDQELYRRAMAAVVGSTDGFVVAGSVATGEESLVAAAELGADLVLMDVNLPGVDGVQATRLLVADPTGPKVILLSTYDEDQVDAAGCGAISYIPKAEFGPDSLSAAWDGATRSSGQG